MKKFLGALLMTLSVVSVQAGTGEAALVGGAAGMFGGLLGGAIVNASSNNRGPSKAEVEARQARAETALLRREHDREKIDGLRREIDRNEVADKDAEIRKLNERLRALEHTAPVKDNSSNVVFMMLISFVIFLSIAVVALAYAFLQRRQ